MLTRFVSMERTTNFGFLIFVTVLSVVSGQMYSRNIYEYTNCKIDQQKRLGVGDGRIPDSAMTASSSKTKRQPRDGRIGSSSGAWSPTVLNANQWLQVDLSKKFIVTGVLLQGRQGSDEFVREFFLQYSDDGQTWRTYTNQMGIPEMFDGNYDDSNLQTRMLIYPIIAQYIRFNPQRWNMVISMRVGIMGCPFVPEIVSFSGSGYVRFNTENWGKQSSDILELRFRTGKPNGVILYASGNQGDVLLLQIEQGYLRFKIDLGSTSTSDGMTSAKVASLVDDNNWHDVIITRTGHEVKVVVDRLVSSIVTNGLFSRLDVDKELYLGGVPYFTQKGLTVKSNMIGCIGNVNFNGAKLVDDALNKQLPTIRLVSVSWMCNVVPKIPVTFPTLESYLKISGTPGSTIQVSFQFRTFDANQLLVYHLMDTATEAHILVQIDENGHIFYKVEPLTGLSMEDVIRNTDIASLDHTFSDGMWHAFYLFVDRERVNCTVDKNSKVSVRKLDVRAANDFYIGGHELYMGFRGCMQDIRVSDRQVELESLTPDHYVGAKIGTCGINDRCTPNPCENSGVCKQTWNTFNCDCTNTGYMGALCHTSAHYISCEIHKQYSNIDGKEVSQIDPDGSGPLEPFQAICERTEQGQVITYIEHDNMGPTKVSGFQSPGSYVKRINYKAYDVIELEEIIDRARSCRQSVAYKCKNAQFLAKPNIENDPNIRSWGWWVGRTYQPMYYWGGAAPGSGKCKCGLEENGCGSGSSTCFCDRISSVSSNVIGTDQGYLVHKEYLPVLEMHLGDTGSTATEDRWSEYTIGELECRGDNLFDNTVTFTKFDGSLEFPTFEAANAGDIWFQFKTTASDGVFIHCIGEKSTTDFVEIRLFQSNSIQFRYDVGNGVVVLSFKSPSPLNDDTWHTVHAEKNRKQAWMRIDDYTAVSQNEDSDLVRMLDLTSPLYIGSLVGFQEGYVGCMRALRVNGRLMDMLGRLRNNDVYGVRAGCVGKCASNPCFNAGTCREGYSSYKCDCSYTPWRGWNCGREVGVNLKKNYKIQYTFGGTQGLSASDFQYATIGFSTKVKQGILLQMRNEKNTEYITVEMNNNGGIKVAMDLGFGRVEENTPLNNIDFANSQVHVAEITRSNFGRTLTIQVDNYPPYTKTFTEADESSKTILKDPKFLYIGNNDTTNANQGFEGCMFRMQVDNIFPLKRAFQDPQPPYIELIPKGKLREDMCGFEEITVSPEPIQTRPHAGVLQNVTYRRVTEPPLSDEEKALVGVGVTLLIILLICIILFCCRHRLEGADYETEEAKGAEFADNPDSAVVYNQTGLPNMPKSYEYFM